MAFQFFKIIKYPFEDVLEPVSGVFNDYPSCRDFITALRFDKDPSCRILEVQELPVFDDDDNLVIKFAVYRRYTIGSVDSFMFCGSFVDRKEAEACRNRLSDLRAASFRAMRLNYPDPVKYQVMTVKEYYAALQKEV